MPDPQDDYQVVGPPQPGMAPDDTPLADVSAFASVLRQKYPELAKEKDDAALARATLKLYPEFKPYVQDPDGPPPPRTAPPELQPPPLNTLGGGANRPSTIGPDPGGRPIVPSAGQYGFEAGFDRLKRGVRNAWNTVTGQPPPGAHGTFDALSRATTDVVVGGLEAATPAILPAAGLAAPETAVGVGVGVGAQKLTEAFLSRFSQAPAHVQELLSTIMGITAGGRAGHAVGTEPTTVTQPRRIPAEAAFQDRVYDTARKSTEAMGDRQNLQAVEDTLAKNRQAAAEADAQLRSTARDRTINRMALAAAGKIHQNGTQGASPFAYLDTLQKVTNQLVVAGTPPIDFPVSDTLESLRQVPPVPATEPPLQLPEHAGPSTATPQNFILGAEPGRQGEALAPPRVDEFGRVLPPDVGTPRLSAPTPQHRFESQQLGDLIDRAQTEEERASLQQQQDRYRAAQGEAAQDVAGELEHWTYDRAGKTIETADGNRISRATAGTPLYNDIVEPVIGRKAARENGPPRALIAQLVRAYAETGATSAADLPPDYLPEEVQRRLDAGQRIPEDEQAFYTSRRFKNQYGRYIEHIIDAVERRAKSRLASAEPTEPGLAPEDLYSIGRGPERVAEPASAGPPPAAFAGEMPTQEAVAGQPPPKALVDGEMPPDWLGLPASEAEQPSLPGAEGVRDQEIPTPPVADAPYGLTPPPPVGEPPASEQGLLFNGGEGHAPSATFLGYSDPRMSASGQPEPMYNIRGGPSDRSTVTGTAALEAQGIAVPETPDFATWKANPGTGHYTYKPGGQPGTGRPSLFDRLKTEQGYIILDVAPGNLEGLKRWYRKQEPTYGDEDWYQAGISALAAGDPDSAYRVASIAAARSFAAAAGGNVARNREAEPLPGIATDQIKKSIETALGGKLPKGASVGEGGVIRLPGNPGGLDPRYTDLILGKNFVKDLVDMVDPSTIIRVEDEHGKLPADLPPELRISKQMADQILQQMPDEVLEPFMETTGLDRGEVAGHLARAASQAGKTLAVFKHWQDAHWDEMLHLNAEMGGTRGPGAAGRLEFAPEERQALVLDYLTKLKAKGKATPEMLDTMKAMGFELPKTIKPDTKDALTYTRRWLTKQRRLAEMGRTLDLAAAGGEDFDRVAGASALGLGNERSTAGQIFDDVFGRARLSFMLSQASTAMKILESHGLRYNMGTLEEVLSGVASRLLGKDDKAAEHFATAQNMSSLKPGTFPTGLLSRPWTDSLGDMFNYTMESVSGLAEDDRRRALATLDAFPREEARMTGAALLGETPSPASKIPGVKWIVDPRTRNVLTVGIRAQAAAIRSAMYDATLRALITAKGDDPGDIFLAEHPGKALIAKYGDQDAETMVGSGVAAALNYTYAGKPLPDSLPGKLVDTMSSLPVVSTMLRMEWAFPRFQFATVPRWIWDRMPGSMVFDLMAKKALGIGRLAKGAEKEALESHLIPTQLAELNKARYQSGKALQDSMASRLDAREAATSLKAVEKKMHAQGVLPEFLDQMTQASETMRQSVDQAQTAAREHRAAEARVSDLLSQVKQAKGRLGALQEVDAPTFEQYLARQAVGAGVLMPMALAIRNSKGAEDTEYYEYKIGDSRWDLRPILAGVGPFLLYADFFSDVAKHTDWDAVQQAHADGKGWNDAFAAGYQGRYTDRKLLTDTMEAWLTVHPLFGTISYITDALSGKQAEGEGSFLNQVLDEFLATTGQAIGSFFLPAQTVTDLAGAVVPSEATTRVPERPGQYTPPTASLTEPAASHVPGVREQVPARVDPFTGQEKALQHPALHQLLGTMLKPLASQVEEEVVHTGLKPGLALPRVSGDAEFDTRVNRAYAQVLQENFPQLLADPEYHTLPLAHRRDVLTEVFKQLKAAAYGMVADQVGDEPALQHLRPDQMAKVQRWQQLATRWAAEGQPKEDESGGPPVPPEATDAPARAGSPPPAAP